MAQRATIWTSPTVKTVQATFKNWSGIAADGNFVGGNSTGSLGIIRTLDASESDFALPSGYNLVNGFNYCSTAAIINDGTQPVLLTKTGPSAWDAADLPWPDVGGSGFAASISGNGRKIVGNWLNADSEYFAILWTDGAIQDLGAPAGYTGGPLQVRYISADGNLIIGSCTFGGEAGESRAVVWTEEGGWELFSDYATARGVDLTGWTTLYGICLSADGRHALIQAYPTGGDLFNEKTTLYVVFGDLTPPP